MAFGDARYPEAKPAPVLFCVDVTGSMTFKVNNGGDKDRMDLANDMIETFIRYVLSVGKAADAVEVAFVLFAHEIVLETDFVRLKKLSEADFHNAKMVNCWAGDAPWKLRVVEAKDESNQINRSVTPRFSCCRDEGTRIDSAVLYCYDKIWDYVKRYIYVDGKGEKKAEFYAPHFVLITDGDPADNKRRLRDTASAHQDALDKMYDHSFTGKDGTNMIVPITVGVYGKEIGQEAIRRMEDYGAHFEDGYFSVRDEKAADDFEKAARFLCKTVVKSLNLAWSRIDDPEEDSRGKGVAEVFGE